MQGEGINDNQMTVAAGLSVGAIGKIRAGKSKGMNSTNIEKILYTYPQLSGEWLLTGRGEMLYDKNKKQDSDIPVARQATGRGEGIPLIPFSAMAGAMKGELSALEYECEHYVVPAFKGADFLMPVKGNSMMPTYVSGDIVACQRVPMTDLFFQWNKPYVLDTTQGAIIKRVKPGHDKQHVLIVSDNKDYDPYELSYEDIHTVALVIGIIRLE